MWYMFGGVVSWLKLSPLSNGIGRMKLNKGAGLSLVAEPVLHRCHAALAHIDDRYFWCWRNPTSWHNSWFNMLTKHSGAQDPTEFNPIDTQTLENAQPDEQMQLLPGQTKWNTFNRCKPGNCQKKLRHFFWDCYPRFVESVCHVATGFAWIERI